MTVYTVHEPPNPPADVVLRAERLVFVKDAFGIAPALLGPLWLALRRQWQPLMVWGVAAVVLVLGLKVVGAGAGWIALALAGLNIVIGFEASDLQRDRLAADGWVELGLANGRDEEDAERDFFQRWQPGAPLGRAGEADVAVSTS